MQGTHSDLGKDLRDLVPNPFILQGDLEMGSCEVLDRNLKATAVLQVPFFPQMARPVQASNSLLPHLPLMLLLEKL